MPVWAFATAFAVAAMGGTLVIIDLLGRGHRARPDGPAAPSRSAEPEPQLTESQRGARQHYLSGVIFYQKGDYAKAQQEWLLAQQLDPANEDAAAGLKRIGKTAAVRP